MHVCTHLCIFNHITIHDFRVYDNCLSYLTKAAYSIVFVAEDALETVLEY